MPRKRHKPDEWESIHTEPSKHNYLITASRVANILNLVTNRNAARAFETFHIMRGNITPEFPEWFKRRGNYAEEIAKKEHLQETGEKLISPGKYTMYYHPDFPWLACTPDYLRRFIDGSRGPHQVKGHGHYVAQKYRDGDAPLDIQAQTMIEMAILEAVYGSIGVILWDEGYKVIDLERNDRWIKQALIDLKEFHERLLNDDPPPVDNSESTYNTLKLLHPDDSGTTVFIPSNLMENYRRIERMRKAEGLLKKRVKELEIPLRDQIKDATYAECPETGERISFRTTERGGYEVKPTKYRVMRREKE